MLDRSEARLRGGVIFWMLFAYCSLFMTASAGLLAQGQQQVPTPTANSPATQKVAPDTAQRIETLEREMALVRYGMQLLRDAAIAVGGLATVGLVVFGFLSWRRESTAVQDRSDAADGLLR